MTGQVARYQLVAALDASGVTALQGAGEAVETVAVRLRHPDRPERRGLDRRQTRVGGCVLRPSAETEPQRGGASDLDTARVADDRHDDL